MGRRREVCCGCVREDEEQDWTWEKLEEGEVFVYIIGKDWKKVRYPYI